MEIHAGALAARIRSLEQAAASGGTATSDLEAIANEAARLASSIPAGTSLWNRLHSDRLYALTLASRYASAVAAHSELSKTGYQPPAYVVPGLATAYAQEGRLPEALALLRRLAATDPDDPAARIRAAYLLSDAHQPREARQVLQEWIVEATHRGSANASQMTDARLALARVDRWHDRLASAEATLLEMSPEQRSSAAWRREYAALARTRGRPRQALGLVEELDDPEARAIAARSWLDLGRPALASAQDHADPGLQVLGDAMKGPRGAVMLRYGNARSPAVSSPNGNQELAASLVLDGPLFAEAWRLGGVLADRRADFRDATPEARYGGVRLVRQVTGGEAVLETGRSVDRLLPGTYAILRAEAWVADGWRLAGRAAFADPEGSLQARASGIGSDALELVGTWRPHESLRVDAGAGHLRFDDGNRRHWQSISAERRIWFRDVPASLFASAYASRNSLDDRPYFNPRHDLTVEVGSVHAFDGPGGSRHGLRPSIARYDQAGFETALIPRLRWTARVAARAGRWWQFEAGIGRPVYDGMRETHWHASVVHGWGQP